MIICSNYFVEVHQILQCVILFSKPSALLTLFHQQLKTINENAYVPSVLGITKSWIYYQFYHKEWAEKLAARTVVNKYFTNEQKHTNDSVRKEQIVDFKKRQRKIFLF